MSSKLKKEIFEWVKTISASLVIAFGITMIIQPTIVDGESMYPTLEDRDYLFVNKLAYTNKLPSKGDVVVFKSDLEGTKTSKKKSLVKRVIALPGEHIVIKDSEVYINDELIKEDYIHDVYTEGNIDMIVPKDHVFTMGDNRPRSLDSRNNEVGTVSLDDIVGEIAFRAFPFNKIGIIE